MKKVEEIYLKNKKEWRDWLELRHLEKDATWLIFCKKNTIMLGAVG